MPDEKTREEIFRIHTKNKPLAEDINLKELAKETEGRAGSDIEFICRKASMLAIREFLGQGAEEGIQKLDIKISKRHFNGALKLLREQRQE